VVLRSQCAHEQDQQNESVILCMYDIIHVMTLECFARCSPMPKSDLLMRFHILSSQIPRVFLHSSWIEFRVVATHLSLTKNPSLSYKICTQSLVGYSW